MHQAKGFPMQTGQTIWVAITCVVVAGCAGQSAQSLPGVTPRNQIVPVLDAHQHMMSPAAMALNVRQPSPPTVAVPAVLTELLSAREKGVDEASYAALFTPDAMLYAEEQGRWWTGAARILDALGNFGAEWRFLPTSFALDGSAGYVAGVLRTASGQDTHNFVLGLKQGADGRWRIGSEMKQPISPLTYAPSIDARKVIEALDDAGIRYATVLSVAYWFGDPEKQVEDREVKTRAENDWVIAETRKYLDRLIPFCGVSPIAEYAIAELERCAALGIRGMKVHRNSKFEPSNPEHLEKLRQFFRAANKHGLAIVIHLRGAPQLYIDHVFPEAPDVPIQIAHMASGMDDLKVFADAIAAGQPGTKNLWFDWTQALPIEDLWTHGLPGGGIGGPVTPEEKAGMVALMRVVGMGRILFGSDMPLPWNPSPREWWRKTILTLPLTDAEIRDIADNKPPYIR
jgi:predicted TIM-barrel fold metal-dependent hydrolase